MNDETENDAAETALFLHLMSAAGRPPLVVGLFGEQVCLACELQWRPCIAHQPKEVPLSRGIPQSLSSSALPKPSAERPRWWPSQEGTSE